MMNHLVNIEQRVNQQNENTGEVTVQWKSFLNKVPCKIQPLSAREFIESKAEQSEITVKITVPYHPGILPSMRFIGLCQCHLGNTYNPEGGLEDHITGQQHITFPCKQGVNLGG